MEYILEVLCVANEKKLPRVKIKTKGKLTRLFPKEMGAYFATSCLQLTSRPEKCFK